MFKKRDDNFRPIIPGAKKVIKKSMTNFSISKGTEKEFLMRKWGKDMSYEKAKEKWKILCSDLKSRYEKLIKKGVSPRDAEDKVKEDFAREL